MIGRKQERQKLDYLIQSNKAELLAIIGRRRVGKTYLIGEHYKNQIVFEFTGTQHSNKQNQLRKFAQKISEYLNSPIQLSVPKDWAEAFIQLKALLKNTTQKTPKPVIFFDEVPWISSKRSGFLNEFAYWWNDWASKQNITVVLCGSAASWMIDKVVNNKGGLHNRITEYINLQPFTLSEVKQYLESNNIFIEPYQIIQLYMSIGGIPHYLQHIRKGESATQVINRICFNKDGILRNEFNNLYAALYEKHQRHIDVVKALSTKWKGLTRNEIIDLTDLSNGGGLTQILNELISSSFVIEILPYKKKKREVLYRLVDEYTLFYLNFIEGKRAGKKDIWLQTSQDHSYRIWRGYAFENLCIKHVEAIKNKLGILGVLTNVSGFRSIGNADHKGIQIDLLIDRSDKCINLCEMKFYNNEITLKKEDAEKMRQRKAIFQEITKTKKTVFNTIVTTYGVNSNQYSLSQVDNVVTMDDLFSLESFE